MTNLAISTVCNLDCPYCFAADHLNPNGESHPYVTLDDFAKQLDYLDRSNIPEARLLGGEPTLHPQFPQLVQKARERDKKIVVFSNGLMREVSLACLESLPVEHCFVMMNVNTPAITPDKIRDRQRQTLLRLGQRAMVGFNIFRVDVDFDFLLDLIQETGCLRRVRLGMAQPCLSGSNVYIRPHQYRAIAERIMEFAVKAAEMGVSLEFDCGFVRCMFADEELAFLEEHGSSIGWHCNPILDIDVHQQVIHCYPLSSWGAKPLTETTTADDLRKDFMEQTAAYRQAGVYAECATCVLKARGDCSGGCLAVTMRRFRPGSFQFQLAVEEEGLCEPG